MRAERHVAAMGSHAHVLVNAQGARRADEIADATCRRIEQLEARWSRFQPHSEISRLNARAGRGARRVHRDTLDLVARALEARQLTEGLFDPTLLRPLEALGYDRDLDLVRSGSPVTAREPGSKSSATATDVRVDWEAGTVELADGVGFDPGGIGKGFAADLVSADAMAAGAAGVLVSLGGDLRVRGESPDGGAWRIDVVDPRDDSVRWLVDIVDGAVATSSTLRRSWRSDDGTTVHHLIDPRTRRPSESGVVAATAVAAEGWQAEVLAKIAIIGADGGQAADGIEIVERLGGAAMAVTSSLDLSTSRWAAVARAADRTPTHGNIAESVR